MKWSWIREASEESIAALAARSSDWAAAFAPSARQEMMATATCVALTLGETKATILPSDLVVIGSSIAIGPVLSNVGRVG